MISRGLDGALSPGPERWPWVLSDRSVEARYVMSPAIKTGNSRVIARKLGELSQPGRFAPLPCATRVLCPA